MVLAVTIRPGASLTGDKNVIAKLIGCNIRYNGVLVHACKSSCATSC